MFLALRLYGIPLPRILSLVIGGQQPYAINPDDPLAPSRKPWSSREGSVEPFVQVLEPFAGARFLETLRARYLHSDPAALEAAWSAALAEGVTSKDLGARQIR